METSDLRSKKIILDIKKAINRVERTIKATLMFSKDHQNISISEFNLLELFKEIENSCEYYSYSKEIYFNFKVQDLIINADFELLLILFQNLVFNAIDAIEEDNSDKGEIAIHHRENKGYHVFSIEDTGVEIIDRSSLFKAFKTTKLNGNGIGLNLSKKIALAHGGDIVLDDNKKIFFVAIKKI
jgi:signal transduction histidine kinase